MRLFSVIFKHRVLVYFCSSSICIFNFKTIFSLQDIQFGCFLAPLSENGINFGFWTDKFYNPQIFFTGSNEGQHVCQCSETNTCGDSIPDLVCQCDGQDPVWRIDQGTITAKHLLPITSFAYGPLVYEIERANFTIGRLKCSG